MAIKTYKYNDSTQLTPHFNVQEFRCKCGGTHNIKIDTELVDKLEQLRSALGAKSITINSGHRCSAHDKAVGGSGSGQHVDGRAADIVCTDEKNVKINSKYVCCVAQDLSCGGIANIDSTYTATHVDTRKSNYWKGDEVKGTSSSVTSDFYSYYNIPRKTVQARLQQYLNALGESLVVDGIIGSKTIAATKRHPISKNDKGEYVKCVQELLNSAGYNCGTPDGIAGAKTLTAIWQACCDKIIK